VVKEVPVRPLSQWQVASRRCRTYPLWRPWIARLEDSAFCPKLHLLIICQLWMAHRKVWQDWVTLEAIPLEWLRRRTEKSITSRSLRWSRRTKLMLTIAVELIRARTKILGTESQQAKRKKSKCNSWGRLPARTRWVRTWRWIVTLWCRVGCRNRRRKKRRSDWRSQSVMYFINF